MIRNLILLVSLVVCSYAETSDYLSQVHLTFALVKKEPVRVAKKLEKICKEMEKDEKISNSEKAEAYYWLAVSYMINNVQKLYFDSIEKSLSFDPNYIKSLLHRAEIYKIMDLKDEAKQDLDRVLKIDPENIKANNLLQSLQSS